MDVIGSGESDPHLLSPMTGTEIILLLDDDHANALLQRRALERSGYMVAVAHTPADALEVLQRVVVSAVIVDYHLQSDITGLGFCARIRAAGYDVPVVLVSGAADTSAIVDAMRLGVSDFIEKDLNFLAELPAVVRRVMDRLHLETQLTGMYRSRARGADLVLLVEEDPADVAAQTPALERAGYQVRTAATPAEALTILREQAVGVMILDQNLSGGETGLSLYDSARSLGYDVPAILVTAFSDHATAARALRAGMRDYLEKTDKYVDELPRMVRRVFTRLRLDRQVAESRALLSSIVGSARDAVLTVEPDGLITLFNRAAEEIFSISAAEALGTSASRFLPELLSVNDGYPLHMPSMRSETQALRRDGSAFPADVTIAETRALGDSFHTIIARDISGQKKTEAELRAANQRLTRTLEDLEQFAYISSHDLQEPLRTILLFVAQLRSRLGSGLDGDAAQYMNYITSSAERMSALISGALQYAQASGQAPEFSTTNLEDVLTRAVRDCEALVRETGASITHDPLPAVKAQGGQIETVLRNLIGNALKYRGDQPPRLHIGVERQENAWKISVRDNGRGFKPEYAGHIFGVFKRLHGSEVPGTGIGLAVCKRIVENYGGRIWAESTPGEGATFHFTLPQAPSAVPHNPR